MKKIYYFSGTGNTLYLAKQLSNNCGYTLINLAKLGDKKLKLEGEVGILFPLYAMGIPKIVEEFLNKIEVGKITYLYAVATCGGSGYGISFNQINSILNKKGIQLNYSNYCHMPDNYLKLFRPLSEDKAKIDIDSSKEKMLVIANDILIQRNNSIKKNILLYPVFLIIYKFWRLGLKKVYKNFKVNEEKCIKCGICKDVCPVKNIELTGQIPTWNKNCEECLACANLCPKIAITCGGKSKYDNRYKNPYIQINELKNQ